MTRMISVALIDDHAMVRHGLRQMLANQPDLHVAGEADTAVGALKLLQGQRFDVALVDITLPDRNGLDLLRQLREQFPAMGVLIVSAHHEDVYAVRALKLGAAGYLSKSCTPEILNDAVRRIAAGGKFVTPSLLQKLAGMLGNSNSTTPHEILTDRELQVLKLLAAGESLVGIASALHLSPSTVTTYRSRILDKMGMKSNAELIRYALEHGL